MTRDAAAIRALSEGRLREDLQPGTLFVVALDDEGAVARRVAELEAEAAATRGSLEALPETDPSRALVEAELALVEARLAFLSLPAERRSALLAEAARRQRLRREAEDAEAARAAAEAEAALAKEAQERALQAARLAEERAAQDLATERARLERARAELAAARQDLARRRQERSVEEGRRLDEVWDQVDRVNAAAAGSEEADAAWDDVVVTARAAREELSAALGARARWTPVPRYAPEAADLPAGLEEERARLVADAATLAAQADEHDAEEVRLLEDAVEAATEREAHLEEARLEALGKLSPRRRGQVLGITSEGVAAAWDEVDRLLLQGSWWRRHAAAHAARTWEQLLDVDTLMAWLRRLGGATLALLVARLGHLRGRAMLGVAFTFAQRRVPTAPLRQRIRAAFHAADALWDDGLRVLTVIAVGAALGEAREIPVIALPYAAAIGYAWYRVAVVAAHAAVSAVAGAGGAVDADFGERLLRSMRALFGFVFAAGVAAMLVEAISGPGALHHHVRAAAGWAGAAIVLALVHRWRDDIADAYLARHDAGALARLVRESRQRWYAVPVAFAAFGSVAASASLVATQSFLLGFEQSRRALAFLFRRRLERVAPVEDAGVELPPAVSARLEDAGRLVDRPHGVVAFDAELAAWRAGARLGAFLLVAAVGHGRSTWVAAAAARHPDVSFRVLGVPEGLRSGEHVARWLGGCLGAPAEASRSPEALGEWMAAQPRSVLVLDDLHRLWLRAIGAGEPWAAICTIVRRCGRSTFVLGTFARRPWRQLCWARQDTSAFRRVVELPSWTEAEIDELLASRSEGLALDWDELIVATDLGERSARSDSTRSDYVRLIWDHSGGSPRVALDAWRRSLAPVGSGRLGVRLFRRVATERLDQLDELDRFLLAEVVWHAELSASDAAAALRRPLDLCSDRLLRLAEDGVLSLCSEAYAVSVPWQPAVLAHLGRRHLLGD